MEYIIEVDQLVKYYGDLCAVDNISFNVEKGGMFSFLGINGAGKSTTINILCQVLPKTSGKVKIDGLDLDKEGLKIKEKIGIVFQQTVLDDELTVKQNLYSRASLYNMKKDQIEDRVTYLIEVLNLQDIYNRPFKQLSGGQRRKVDLARALIHQPEILFLDEPTTGLDPQSRIVFWDVIKKFMNDDHLTVFLTTHYMEEVNDSNYVVIIDEGKIVGGGTPSQLKSTYASDVLKVFVPKGNNELDELISKHHLKANYMVDHYQINVPSSEFALTLMQTNPALFKNFEVIKGNMDQVFLNMTGKRIEEHNNAS